MKDRLKSDYLWTPMMFLSGAMGLFAAMLLGVTLLLKRPDDKRAVRAAAATVAYSACILTGMSIFLIVYCIVGLSSVIMIILAALLFFRVAAAVSLAVLSFFWPAFFSWECKPSAAPDEGSERVVTATVDPDER